MNLDVDIIYKSDKTDFNRSRYRITNRELREPKSCLIYSIQYKNEDDINLCVVTV